VKFLQRQKKRRRQKQKVRNTEKIGEVARRRRNAYHQSSWFPGVTTE
jgi:hypothetical protein